MKKSFKKILLIFSIFFTLGQMNGVRAEALNIGMAPNLSYTIDYRDGNVRLKVHDFYYNQNPNIFIIDHTMTNIDAKYLSYSTKYSADVKALQFMLYANSGGTNGLKYDGYYGAATVQAVKDFQRQRGLSIDGHAGPNTLNTLVHVLRWEL